MSKIDSRIANLGDNQPVTRTPERALIAKPEAQKQEETTTQVTLTPEQIAAEAAKQTQATEQVSEDVNVIDPNKPIRLPNGETVTFKEWNDRGMRYDQYVRKQSETDAQYKSRMSELEKSEADYKNAKAWRATAEGDTFASAYLLALSRTGNQQEALKEAQRVSGVNASTVSSSQGQQPQPPNDDPSSPEYTRWFMTEFIPWQSEQAAQRVAAPQINALQKEVEKLRAERAEEVNLSNAQKQRIEANTTMASTAYDRLYSLTGIDIRNLPPEEVAKVTSAIEQGFTEIGLPPTDTKLWSTEEIRDRDVDHAVRAAYGKLTNPYVKPTLQEPVLQKPRAGSTQLHNAAPATGSNGTSEGARAGSLGDRFASPMDRSIQRLIGG